jgi:hypothetical protein
LTFENTNLDHNIYSDYNVSDRVLLAHLSWKLKWAILIAHCPSSVCL